MNKLDPDHKTSLIVEAYLPLHLYVLGADRDVLVESAYEKLIKFQQFVYGIKEMPQRWKLFQSLTTSLLCGAVGAALVK